MGEEALVGMCSLRFADVSRIRVEPVEGKIR